MPVEPLPPPCSPVPSPQSGLSARWCWVIGAVICLFLANAWRVDADADLWGHLRFGLDTLADGKLATSDPYSYTASGAPWTNHEWLSELTFAVCYRLADATGLVVLRACLLALTFSAIAVLIVRRKLSPEATLALAIFGITVLPQFFRIRPQMFTYAAFAWLIVLCDQHRPGRRWGLALVPLLVGIWCNFHAGFVAGLGIFGIYWCLFGWESRRLPDRNREWRFLGIVLALSIAATLCNPYGVSYWQYVLFAVTMPRPEITEWRSVWQQNPVVLGCYLAAVLVPAICWLKSTQRGAVAETCAFVLVTCLAAQHARHIPFVMLLGAAVFIRRWPEWQVRLAVPSSEIQPATLNSLPARFALALLLLLAFLGGATKLSREVAAAEGAGVVTVDAGEYPVGAVAFLKRERVQGNLYCGFSWGEYCLWHLAPRCPVFCDGRYETVYPAAVSKLALGSLATDADRRTVLDSYPTEIVLIGAADPAVAWISGRRDFVEVYQDGISRVFVKRLARLVPWLEGMAAANRLPATTTCVPQVPFPG